LNLFICIAEPASFYGSTGGVGPWVKIKDDGLAAQVLQRDFFAVLVLQSEVGSLIIDVHGYFSGKIEVDYQWGGVKVITFSQKARGGRIVPRF
jgi:hypothetical protein